MFGGREHEVTGKKERGREKEANIGRKGDLRSLPDKQKMQRHQLGALRWSNVKGGRKLSFHLSNNCLTVSPPLKTQPGAPPAQVSVHICCVQARVNCRDAGCT